MNKILFLILSFCFGIAGGLWAQAFLLPSMAANPAFQNWQFIKDWNARTQVIAPVQQVTVKENEALVRLIQKVQGAVVAVQSSSGKTGSGLIFTSDGLVVTLSSLVPQGYNVQVYEKGEPLPVQVLKRDFQNNLVLLKVEKTGLQTVGFAGNGGVELGERILLLAKILGQEEPSVSVDEGIVKTKENGAFTTSLFGTSMISGAPMFTVEGRVAGLAFVDSKGSVHAISSSVLRTFLGL